MDKKPKLEGRDISTVISQVKRALIAAEWQSQVSDTSVLEIESLELTLKAFLETEAGGEIKIKIPIINLEIGAGSSLTTQETQTITLQLKLPTEVEKTLGAASIESSLIDAINTIREGIKAAAENKPQFTLDKATIEINFVMGTKGNVEVVAKGSYDIETTNVLKLELKQPSSPTAEPRMRFV